MKTNYSKDAIKFIKENYDYIINKKDFISVSIGGSVARGYATNLSDIDLICISVIEKSYKKIFKNIYQFKVEIHIIPVQYIYNLLENVSKYSNLNYKLPNNINTMLSSGAKKCNLIERKQDCVNKLLSDWRELKKIVDSIIFYEDKEKFLTNLKNCIDDIKFYDKVFIKFEDNMYKYSNIDKLINMLKLYSLYQGNVFSKVLWTDLYIDTQYIKTIKKYILDNIPIDIDNIKNFYNWEKKRYKLLIEKHHSIKCDFCENDYLQCNIMRCINDYIIDAKKARKNKMKLGEILSIKKVIEYVTLLYKKIDMVDQELETINNKIMIDDKTINKIWQLIKKECINNAYTE